MCIRDRDRGERGVEPEGLHTLGYQLSLLTDEGAVAFVLRGLCYRLRRGHGSKGVAQAVDGATLHVYAAKAMGCATCGGIGKKRASLAWIDDVAAKEDDSGRADYVE